MQNVKKIKYPNLKKKKKNQEKKLIRNINQARAQDQRAIPGSAFT